MCLLISKGWAIFQWIIKFKKFIQEVNSSGKGLGVGGILPSGLQFESYEI